MSAVLAAAALVVATGSIAALALADARLGLVGLAAALLGAGLLADPLPGPAILGVRLTAALLAVALLRAAAPAVEPRGAMAHTEAPAHPGWLAAALLGVAGGVAGLALAAGLASFEPVIGPVLGSGGALAADATSAASSLLTPASWALALAGGIVAIALPALLTGVGLRRAAAAVLFVQAAVLARVGLAGQPGALEEVVLGVLLVATATAASLIAAAGRAVPEGGARQA
jgi:hypothetical protein